MTEISQIPPAYRAPEEAAKPAGLNDVIADLGQMQAGLGGPFAADQAAYLHFITSRIVTLAEIVKQLIVQLDRVDDTAALGAEHAESPHCSND